MNITDTEYEILNFIKDRDPTGTKGVSNMFIHGKLKHSLSPKQIRYALRQLSLKNMIQERNFYFFLRTDAFKDQIVQLEKKTQPPSITLSRINFVIRDFYDKTRTYPLPLEIHTLFEKIYNTEVNQETFTRTIRKLGEDGKLERIPEGNKFRYKPKGNYEDKALKDFTGVNL